MRPSQQLVKHEAVLQKGPECTKLAVGNAACAPKLRAHQRCAHTNAARTPMLHAHLAMSCCALGALSAAASACGTHASRIASPSTAASTVPSVERHAAKDLQE